MLRFVRFRHGTNRTHTFLVSVLFREKKNTLKRHRKSIEDCTLSHLTVFKSLNWGYSQLS